MNRIKTLGWRCAVLGALTLAMGGCGIIADMFSPSLFANVGLDPASLQPSQGAMIVAFKNTTQYPAMFFAFKAANPQDLTSGAKSFSVQVQPSSVGNEVLDCPVGMIIPGSYTSADPNQPAQYSAVAALLTGIPTGAGGNAATATATAAYTGTVLRSGTAFNCGDVVEVQLIDNGVAAAQQAQQQGGTTQTQARFTIAVRVIPGG